MMAARKFESYCIEPSEKWLFAGNISGQISVIDLDKFTIIKEVQAHAGSIHAITVHSQLPYIATLSTDRSISVWRYDQEANLRLICHISIRDFKPANDHSDIAPFQSTSQAIGFHDSQPRIVTRSGNGALVELEFDEDGNWQLLYCLRVHRESDLVTSRFVKNSDMVLTGSILGELVLSQQGTPIRIWQIGHGTLHWAEYIEGSTYLLASDSRCVARIEINGEKPPIAGPLFARDDLEHVTYNRISGRAFASSFDRTIYELDPQTCKPTQIVFRPPFKCRWIKTLERSPSTMIIQCRNGGLYKVNVDTQELLAVIKETPNALWTGVNASEGRMVLAGEGDALFYIQAIAVDPMSRRPVFKTQHISIDVNPDSYTKRMVQHPVTGHLLLGRTDGYLVVVEDDQTKNLINLQSAIRDIAVHPELPEVFAACEDGHVYKINLDSGEIMLAFKSSKGQPMWSLSYNPTRNILAVGERSGRIFFLSAEDFSVVCEGQSTIPKRMKWVDDETLLYVNKDQLYKFNLTTRESSLLVDCLDNTIEDFIWDEAKRYLLMINYTCRIALCDFHTGQLLNYAPDQMDYSKGLIWVDTKYDSALYPLDFITFGRSGNAHHFRIHDEKILALGPVEI